MNNINLQRKESQIHQLIASIITIEITNVNVIDPVVMDVKLSADLSHCKVFVNFGSKKQKGLESLNNSAGFIRSSLSRSLKWRKVPHIHFYHDEVSEYGSNIDAILRNIKNENEK
ncbi:30S ribosome-binding factor RbfA [Mycoplasmopsis alligatoris]|uniref:Ribosome-binding factor A n=1 Tax=Mycoplasmopsis alligatoris A21JP2 TaxID=747682 RepID=D4XV46_9BACT|nr:30S ribosome-binding factor RbfA [Mycoplasmopsis alligatoris]EFF41776.1 ribosome-binding factor A [Mycoplasmopsis alligatoris A21JP2]